MGDNPSIEERIQELQRRIAEVEARVPPHSVPPAILQELDDLEAELDRLQRQA